MEKIKHYEGLYGDRDFKRQSDYIFLERIETRSSGFDGAIETHVHSRLYQFFFIGSGAVSFQGPSEKEELNSPCLLVLPPSTLHGLRYSPGTNGQILTLSDTVLENTCR